MRGTFHSQGVFDPMMNEGPDGADTVAWLRRQAWADGRVGTFSASYNGGVQMLTAAEGPPGLITAFSQVAATDQFKNEWVYMDGTLALTSLQWTLQMLQGFHPPLSADQRRQLAADYKGLGLSSSAPMPEIFRAVATKLPLSAMPIGRPRNRALCRCFDKCNKFNQTSARDRLRTCALLLPPSARDRPSPASWSKQSHR